LNSPLSHFCYAFKGSFLPSGNLDGIVWKPSQGAKPAGKNLLKRYFYYKKDNMKINRQVIWLTTNENWCFLDYRYNFKGKIKLKDIGIPEGFDFANLLLSACTGSPQSLLLNPSSSKKRSKKTATKSSSGEESPILLEVGKEQEGLSMPISSTLQYTDIFVKEAPKEESRYLSPFDGCVADEDIFIGDFEFDSTTFSESVFDIPFSPKDTLEDEDTVANRKRPRATSPDLQYNPASPLLPSSLLPTSLGLTSLPWDWQWPTPSNIFNSGLEYFFDMISHLICNQLMFQRRFFKKYAIDGEATLDKVRQVCVTFDLKEFPGGIIKTFFEYVSENYFHIRGDQLPTIYCLVCGHDIKCHDERVHREFFGHLDQTLVASLQDKAKNMYELVKQYIIFLLKNPNSHETLKIFLMEHLHCPFCSGTNGVHIPSQHNQWTTLWKIDPPAVSGPPAPSSNVYDYTKSTFEWLVDQVPFYVPPFLLSLHFAKYLRTFMECLVTCWNSVRLYL
jgi:hypothetical protein